MRDHTRIVLPNDAISDGHLLRPLLPWVASLVVGLTAGPAGAQGTRDDYQRAARLPQAFAQTVFRDSVQPQWIEGNRFWYRVSTGRQRHQFVLVNAAEGRREPLFDHGRLAKALSAKLRRAVDAEALPLAGLSVAPDLKQVRFTVDRTRLTCELSSYGIEESKTDGADGLSPLTEIPAASSGTGAETEVLFVNQSEQEVRVSWRSLEGRRVLYATVAPGGEHRQHTFAGHVWDVADRQDRPLIGFVAIGEPSRAIVTKGLGPLILKVDTGKDPSQSPDGRWRVRFDDHNVVLSPTDKSKESLKEVSLTNDGTADDAYAGPVHWSPDSRQFVVLQTRAAQRHPVHIVESSPRDQLQPKLQTFDYLKPGDRIAHPRPRLFDVETLKNVPIEETLFANPWSLTELEWDRDSQRFRFLYNERGHQTLRLIAVDNAGAAAAVIEETSRTFVDYNSKLFLRRLHATGEILWMSERDGWNHLWLVDATTGQVKQQVTRGEWVVRRVESVDEERRQIWFLAGGVKPEQDPYHLHLCRVNFDGSGFVVLTEGDGTHEVTFSPDRQWFLDKWSRVDQPPVTELRQASDGRLLCELERADHHLLLEAGWAVPERFTAQGRDGETAIHGIIVKPSNFNPEKRYPVVEQIYAGPHGAHVPKAFGTLTGVHAMAELGFIVVQIDGMGTNWRSKKFHDVCWRNLADAGFPDRIAWIKAAAKTRPWIDLDRVGIYGGSAGGQNAMRALIDHHSFYKVAVADCGCHDNRMDKIWWNELWMGFPIGPHYEVSSNAVQAHRMQGKLMLIVGELDRNVDPASTMQVVSALQKADKDVDLVIVAGAGHGAAETPYGNRRRSDFLVRHLYGKEPRSKP